MGPELETDGGDRLLTEGTSARVKGDDVFGFARRSRPVAPLHPLDATPLALFFFFFIATSAEHFQSGGQKMRSNQRFVDRFAKVDVVRGKQRLGALRQLRG
jgi:cytochrome c1